MFNLLRYALSGSPLGAPMADIAEVVGRKEVEERIKNAIDTIN